MGIFRIFWEEEVEMRHRLVFYMQSMLLYFMTIINIPLTHPVRHLLP